MKTYRQWLQEEPFTLTLSSGFFGFFAHCGLLSALEEQNDSALLPSQICGSSAGALIGGIWASGLNTKEISEVLFGLQRRDFWDPGIGFGLLRGRRFENLLKGHLNTLDLQSCKVPLRISTHHILRHRTEVFSSGYLPKILVAACAFPFLFQPQWIQKKPYLDGGILDRPGFEGLESLKKQRVFFHHLVDHSDRQESPRFPVAPPNSIGVAFPHLPKLGPFKLERGKEAFELARQRMRSLLDQPIGSNSPSEAICVYPDTTLVAT